MVDDMRVYIANLGKYNEGELVGDWFSFPIDEEDVAERIGLNSYYEEYAVHDTDNFPIEIGEYISIQELNIGYVAKNGKKHSFTLAENFARDKSGGKKVTYTNPIAVARNGGWRYGYGNMFYVELVSQYLTVSQVSGELAQKIMNEALKYQGWDYVYGGSNPNTSFDCSGLVQWCYGKAGINLPRTAQAQYDATQHIPLSQAQAGDLVFFHSTYNAGTYVTHVGIYVGNNQMYHAGDPIGYADLNNSYWQQHLIGAGRIKQ